MPTAEIPTELANTMDAADIRAKIDAVAKKLIRPQDNSCRDTERVR